MGVIRFFKKKENILFSVFLILYLVYANSLIGYELGYDESRHTAQGHFFYDYFRTIARGDYLPVREFLDAYTEKGYNIGWLALYDPPFHAVVQAGVFMLGGVNAFTARFATEILSILGAFLLFALSRKIFRSNFKAFAVVALFYMSAFGLDYTGRALLPMPIQAMMVGWFYFTLHRKGRAISFRVSKFYFRFRTNIIIGGLFLTAATLMKYQSLIFAGAFMVVYLIYLYYRHVREHGFGNPWQSLKESPAWELGLGFGMQCAIFLMIGGWWLKLSLWDHQIYQRILYEGTGRGRQYTVQFLTFFIVETLRVFYYISLFALVPVILWVKDRKDSWVSKNMDVFLYVVVIYVLATFLIANKQLRYMVHAVPILSILIVKGIDDVTSFIEEKIRFKHLFPVVIIVILSTYAYLGVGIMQQRVESNGLESFELIDYLKGQPDPKYVINVKASGNTTGYYFNPDLFVHNTMRSRRGNEPDPRKFQQWSNVLYWQGVKQNPEGFVDNMDGIAEQVNVYVVLFKRDSPDDIMVEPLGALLRNRSYSEKELTYYKIYSKGP